MLSEKFPRSQKSVRSQNYEKSCINIFVFILDEVEMELAKLDRDIEDMKKDFKNSMNPNEKQELPLKGDNVLAEDSPEF